MSVVALFPSTWEDGVAPPRVGVESSGGGVRADGGGVRGGVLGGGGVLGCSVGVTAGGGVTGNGFATSSLEVVGVTGKLATDDPPLSSSFLGRFGRTCLR